MPLQAVSFNPRIKVPPRRSTFLRDNFVDHMPMHVGEAAVDAVVADGELRVVDAQQVQDGGVDVVDLGGVFAVERFVAPLVGEAVSRASFDAAAAEPVGEDEGVVVAAFGTLGRRHSAELGGPEDERVVEQAALFQIFDERGCSD